MEFMRLILNGEPKDLSEGLNLQQLLDQLGIDIMFANRARVPHKLVLPTDRLADFGIQDHADQVMTAIQKQPGYDAQATMPVTSPERGSPQNQQAL